MLVAYTFFMIKSRCCSFSGVFQIEPKKITDKASNELHISKVFNELLIYVTVIIKKLLGFFIYSKSKM